MFRGKFPILIPILLGLGSGHASVRSGEVFTYLRKPVRQGVEEARFQMVFSVQKDSGQTLLEYRNEHPDGKWLVRTLEDGTPLQVDMSRGEDNLSIHFAQDGLINLKGKWNGRETLQQVRHDPKATVENLMLLRTLPFQNGSKHKFQLFRPDKLPKLVPYQMYYKVMGEKTVTVRAGTFRCKEILLTCDNFLYRRLYHSYFYVSDDANRYFVKEVNPSRGFEVELESVSLEKSEK